MRLSFPALLVIALGATGGLYADVVTYDLSATMNDGGYTLSVGGQFDYNTVTNAVTNWDLPVSGPTSAGYCSGTSGSPCYTFQPETGATATFSPNLFTFKGPDTGGYTDYLYLVPGSSSDPLPTATYTLGDTSYLKTVGPTGTIGTALFISGSLTPVTAATPEPRFTWALLAVLCAASLVLRRRANFAMEFDNATCSCGCFWSNCGAGARTGRYDLLQSVKPAH